jgi:secreted PhoX family phosphatase
MQSGLRRGIGIERRTFLKGGLVLSATLGLGAPFRALAQGGVHIGPSPDYGPLGPTPDANTGLSLLQLPPDFSYVSMSFTGDPMPHGAQVPGLHDGGAALAGPGRRVHYVRNHEQSFVASRPDRQTSFAPARLTYDAGGAPGGTTTVVFDPSSGQHVRTYPSLSGTVRNCAGGPTPWNSWLSCEETLAGTSDVLEQTHGWVFEVPAKGRTKPAPIVGLGRFSHEAAAVDPATGIVYETEDRGQSGIYRFVPNRYGRLQNGGTLQMLRVPAVPGLITGQGLANGEQFDVDWVPIADPTSNPFAQGRDQGGAIFRRGEGMWYGNGRIHFCSTNGGVAGQGQIFELDPASNQLTMLFESPGAEVLSQPDNVTVSPHGGILLCEDPFGNAVFVRGLSPQGEIFDFVRNDVVFDEPPNDVIAAGDYRSSEFAGASFSPDGVWLFLNVQRPGITFAITGPWERGPL